MKNNCFVIGIGLAAILSLNGSFLNDSPLKEKEREEQENQMLTHVPWLYEQVNEKTVASIAHENTQMRNETIKKIVTAFADIFKQQVIKRSGNQLALQQIDEKARVAIQELSKYDARNFRNKNIKKTLSPLIEKGIAVLAPSQESKQLFWNAMNWSENFASFREYPYKSLDAYLLVGLASFGHGYHFSGFEWGISACSLACVYISFEMYRRHQPKIKIFEEELICSYCSDKKNVQRLCMLRLMHMTVFVVSSAILLEKFASYSMSRDE